MSYLIDFASQNINEGLDFALAIIQLMFWSMTIVVMFVGFEGVERWYTNGASDLELKEDLDWDEEEWEIEEM